MLRRLQYPQGRDLWGIRRLVSGHPCPLAFGSPCSWLSQPVLKDRVTLKRSQTEEETWPYFPIAQLGNQSA